MREKKRERVSCKTSHGCIVSLLKCQQTSWTVEPFILWSSNPQYTSPPLTPQSMSSNYPHVRRLLKALADKMPHTNPVARTSEDGLLPYSIPSPSSLTSTPSRSAPPTAESIEANRCVELCLSGQETAMMMHGLRCMGSEWAQVRAEEPSLNVINDSIKTGMH